jgi:hypothetical protein
MSTGPGVLGPEAPPQAAARRIPAQRVVHVIVFGIVIFAAYPRPVSFGRLRPPTWLHADSREALRGENETAACDLGNGSVPSGSRDPCDASF